MLDCRGSQTKIKMRKIIVILMVLLILGGGGAGVYFYFFQPAEASAGAAAEEANKEHEKQAKGGGHGEAPAAMFVELDPLILPVMDGNGPSQVVSIVVALEVADEETAKTVEAMSPKLKDAYIQDMYGMMNQYAALKGGVVQVGMIKKRLNEITTHVMGENVVQDVLLQVVQQRPI